MDPSLSEDSTALPLDMIEQKLRNLYEDNEDLEKSIEQKKVQIQERRNVTAALVMERNWYIQVLARLTNACKQDERLKNVRDVLENSNKN